MQAEANQASDLARAEARLPRWMMGSAGIVTVGLLAAGRGRVAAGFAVGALVALLNYYWLHDAIQTVFNAGSARVPKVVAAKLVLRYPLVFAGLYLFYKTGWLPLAGILAGLFVPVAGILVEAGWQIREGLRKV